MRLQTVIVENWMRYRGFHEKAFEADVYAVLARHEADETRSNWLGKTSFMHAIPFALFGAKPPGVRLEDDWITHGEKRAGVCVVFEGPDRFTVQRTRKRGKSTQLRVTWNDEDDEAKRADGDEAQDRIVERLGVTEADFFASNFFAQKQMARFVVAQPRDRHRVVSAWLDLAPLQRCADNVGERLARLAGSERDKQQRLGTLEAMEREVLSKHFAGEDGELSDDAGPKALGELSLTAKREAEDLREAAAKVQERIDEHAERLVETQAAAEYAGTKDEALKLRAEIRAMNPAQLEADVAAKKILAAETAADHKVKNKARLDAEGFARGEFDGVCPVMCEECPVVEDVREIAAENLDKLATVRTEESVAGKESADAALALYGAESELDEARRENARYQELVKKCLVLKPQWEESEKKDPLPDLTELRAELDAAWEESNDAVANSTALERDVGDVRKWRAETDKIREGLAALRGDIATHRAAAAIFGRNGAQRRASEDALSEIERDANALLSESGIGLRLRVLWGREASKGLATSCDSCGAPFPSSQRVKECGTCGAGRGPKTIDKLDLELSDRSGAAEDLAGIAFQLSAAAWLRRARGAQMSVCFIDEPFGALDESHRRALSSHLAAMLRGRYGFEQSFIVSHDRAVMDALPNRVEIVATDERSTFA